MAEISCTHASLFLSLSLAFWKRSSDTSLIIYLSTEMSHTETDLDGLLNEGAEEQDAELEAVEHLDAANQQQRGRGRGRGRGRSDGRGRGRGLVSRYRHQGRVHSRAHHRYPRPYSRHQPYHHAPHYSQAVRPMQPACEMQLSLGQAAMLFGTQQQPAPTHYTAHTMVVNQYFAGATNGQQQQL